MVMSSNDKKSLVTEEKKIPLFVFGKKIKDLFFCTAKRKKNIKPVVPADRQEIEPYRPDSSIKFPWDNELLIFDDFNHAMDVYESGDYTLYLIKSSSEGGPYWDVSPRVEVTKLNQRQTIEALVAGGIDKDRAAKEVIGWSAAR